MTLIRIKEDLKYELKKNVTDNGCIPLYTAYCIIDKIFEKNGERIF